MSAQEFNLQARTMPSRVLSSWLASRAGSAERLGARSGDVRAYGENSHTSGLSIEELMQILGAGHSSAAGVPVTPETGLRQSTAYACVGLVAGAIATLPLGIFERKGNERSKAEHEYWWLFNEQANEDMTSATAWEYLLSSKMFEGDGFAQLLRPGIASSRVIGWRPLHPRRVQPFCDTDGTVYYRITPTRGSQYVLDSADIVHLPSLGFDGITSPSPITYAAREAIGVALAAEAYNARFFSQGATFDYALKSSSNLKPDQLDQLKASLLQRVSGGAHSRVPLILSGGLEPVSLSINSKDAEILATRLFSVEEICRVFGVPPHMVGHTTKSTSWGTGIEQQGIGFVRYTLQRHLTGIAQELNRKLWPTRARFFAEHITAALERGDTKSRFESYRIALGRAGESPWMDIDEVRRLENLPPNPNLKAAAPAPAAAPEPEPAPQPAPPPAPTEDEGDQ